MTIKDLSKQTGYSVGTISRVLNDQPNVSEKARKAILEAAEESGFQLNINAKMLKQQHSNAILAVVKGTDNQLFSALTEAIQNLVAQTPYSLIVDYLDEDSNEVLHAVKRCREKKPLGILFLGGNEENFRADFSQISQPAVLVTNDGSNLGFQNLSSVTSHDREAARQAMELLIALGHSSIGIIGGDREVSDTARVRHAGCMDAVEGKRVAVDYETVRFSYADGYRAAQALLGRMPELTAIFATADVMAIGAIRALRDKGLRVPEDVSVVGYDGLAIGEYTVPTLSTVKQDTRLLASKAIQILQRQIEEKTPAKHETIPAKVVSRESIRKI